MDIIIDKQKLNSAIATLKKYLLVYLFSLALLIISYILINFKNSFIQNIGGACFIIGWIGAVVLKIIIVFFKMWNLCVSLGKSFSATSSLLAASLIIPTGELIFSLILLRESKKMLQNI